MQNEDGQSLSLENSSCVDLEKQVFDLKQLLEISKSLNSTLDYPRLIDSILFTCMAQMKVIKAGLFARKGLESTNFSLHRNYKGFELDHNLEYAIPDDHALFQLFSRKYAIYTLEEIHAELGSLNGLDALQSLEPSLIVPLKTKGIVNGIIILSERIDTEFFDAYEREYILNVAVLASIAINNAFLFEMTTTDMMTKLKMKHYFYSSLMERIQAASDHGKDLSVVMIDIDHFKKFNDTYGHSCGDLVLQRVAKSIAECVRSIDIAARYGGEEFILLLSDADAAAALIVAERVCKLVELLETEYEGTLLKVTVSCGVAVYDKVTDVSARALIDRADKAMYQSKQNGRNRVSISG